MQRKIHQKSARSLEPARYYLAAPPQDTHVCVRHVSYRVWSRKSGSTLPDEEKFSTSDL